jgi:hypothetical protein
VPLAARQGVVDQLVRLVDHEKARLLRLGWMGRKFLV